MLDMLQSLVRHKWHANASLLRAIRQCDAAANDEELRKRLHHIVEANRYWLSLIRQKASAREDDPGVRDTFDGIVARFKETAIAELDWIMQIPESDLLCLVKARAIEARSFSVAEVLTQDCLHAHGHRAQCALRLRDLGGAPPMMDFILWLVDKPDPDWPTRTPA
jgi:uncharacterized damage-inducible protein DinB